MGETLLSTFDDSSDIAAFKMNDLVNHLNNSLQDPGLSRATIPLAHEDAADYVRYGHIGEGTLLAKLSRHAALNSFLTRKIHVDTFAIGVCQFYVRFGGDLADLIDSVQVHKF
jgi:hypothetical protein